MIIGTLWLYCFLLVYIYLLCNFILYHYYFISLLIYIIYFTAFDCYILPRLVIYNSLSAICYFYIILGVSFIFCVFLLQLLFLLSLDIPVWFFCSALLKSQFPFVSFSFYSLRLFSFCLFYVAIFLTWLPYSCFLLKSYNLWQ